MVVYVSGVTSSKLKTSLKEDTPVRINKTNTMFSSILSEIAQLRTNYPILSPALLIFIGLQVYYRLVVVKPIQLHCKRNSLYHVSSIIQICFNINKLEIKAGVIL